MLSGMYKNAEHIQLTFIFGSTWQDKKYPSFILLRGSPALGQSKFESWRCPKRSVSENHGSKIGFDLGGLCARYSRCFTSYNTTINLLITIYTITLARTTHCRSRHFCRILFGPPNFFMSLQKSHCAQSSVRLQGSHSPHMRAERFTCNKNFLLLFI